MTASFSNLTKKPAHWLLIIFLISSVEAFSQKNLSGNLNEPFAHVTTLWATDEVEVDDVSEFSVGDTILLIQMQGVGILTTPIAYGNYQTSFGADPGAHEFLIIQGINANRITFTNDRLNNYDTKGNVQIVRVPYYFTATVTGTLSVDPWDPVTGKGGVLALILGKTLKLDADIDLSGSGLKGAPVTSGDGKPRNDPPLTDQPSYPFSFTNAGNKGEGIAIHDESGILLYPNYAKGEGKNYTGGGGGNGRFSGGGGGSHRGDGGIGGYEDYATPQLGGYGGIKVVNVLSLANGRIFMGGGGGSSTSMSGAGGNGGGLVIIVTDTVIGNGKNILVNGNNGANALVTGGAGGGGAGGSIAISLTSFGPASSVLNLQARGGNGGNNAAAFGEGGGGGGGLIYLSTTAAANVVTNHNGGNAGIPTDGGVGGGAGEKKEDFKAVLNGFLFNSIRSSVTGDQIDSICSNTDPPKLTGTIPIGGSGTYTYTWERSTDNITFNPIALATAIDYDPPVPELSTVYYRRVVSDGTLTDISKSVKMIVQPFIKNNTIGADQTICYNQDPAALVPTGVLADGNGHYAFRWQSSADDVTFAAAPNTNNAAGYDPANLIVNTWYRRTVTSGRCIDISSSVAITVLDTISKNRIINQLPQDKCFGSAYDNLQGSTTSTLPNILAGGDNTFRFKWQGNVNGAGWSDAPGINNIADYNPTELPERVPMNEYFFRRVVFSGPGDVCQSTSNTVHLRDFPVIKNNAISSAQTICAGFRPFKLVGVPPVDGDGTYKYTWQDSSKTNSWIWTDIPGFINSDSVSFKPPVLADTVRYRRIVYSSSCSDVSKSIRIDVHKAITKFSIETLSHISDTTLCNGQNPNRIKGELSLGGTLLNDFTYRWLSSDNNTDFNPVSVSGTSPGYDPPILSKTQYYKRESKSGACTALSGTVTVNVLPLISNNVISPVQTVCYNTPPAQLTGAALAGGSGTYLFSWEQSTDGGATWNNATGNHTDPSGNYSPPALTSPAKYRRWVTSGAGNCCSDLSPAIDISVHPALPTGQILNSDTTVYSGTPVIVKLALTGSGPWEVTMSENSVDGSPLNINQSNAEVSVDPLASGAESFTYMLVKIKDANGCLAVNITGQLIAKLFPGFEAPEGFSPNGDGINDTFEVKGLNPSNPELQIIDLRIFTSSGSEVFKTTNDGGGELMVWDGKDSSGSELPQGTYYYLLKIWTVLNGQTYKLSGFIILKRY